MTAAGKVETLAAGGIAPSGGSFDRHGASDHRFYFRLAAFFVLLAFGGFVPTYWLRVIDGSVNLPPLIHIHGLLFFAWTLFYLFQTGLVAYGRTPSHRAWGMAGIALFTTMICTALAGRIANMQIDEARGFGDAGRRFAIFTFFDAVTLPVLFALAIIHVRRREWHKRFMVALGIAMLPPAVARLFLTISGATPGGPPPPVIFGLAPNLLTYFLLFLIPVLHDWRRVGRVHPIYLCAAAWLMIGKSLMIPFAATEAWLRAAGALQHIAG